MAFNSTQAISRGRSARREMGLKKWLKNTLGGLLGSLEENQAIFIIIVGAICLQMNVSSGTSLPTTRDRRGSDVPTFARQTQATGECPYVYKCKCALPMCKPGLTPVKDGCDCCYMCPRQQGDICNYKDICDKTKELYCDIPQGSREGICRAERGLPCEFEGIPYKDGQHVDLNCSLSCTCQNGQFSCTNKCPWEERRPSPVYCKNPMLVQIEGRCCKEWVCPYNHSLPDHEFDPSVPAERNCKPDTSAWSECSETCGMGISIRLTNRNPQCENIQERRLCFVRPCGQQDSQFEKDDCKSTWKLRKPIHLQYNECESVELFTPKYCSTCKKNKCCGPGRTKTRDISFRCPEGKIIQEKYMWIRNCDCHPSNRCPFN